MPQRKSAGRNVAIVTTNAETSADLRRYFEQFGVHAYDRHELQPDALQPATTAIVLFPDDFPQREVVSYLRGARAAQPRLALIAVTRYPQRFEQIEASDGSALELVVLPRPLFGWTILDAVQEQEH
jgi:hypothetical protein